MRRYAIPVFWLFLLTSTFSCGRPGGEFSPNTCNVSRAIAASSFTPGITRKGSRLYGEGLLDYLSDGSGIFFGVGMYTFLTDRQREPENRIRDAICMLGNIGFNHFRLFTALGVADNRSAFVSPWANTTEWQRRRDIMLDAGVECGVYIQLSLFDEKERNDESRRGSGYSRSDNSWNGKTPSLEVAKDLTARYYLAGIDPKSPRGRILLVEHFNEPNTSDWDPDWAEPFDQWLKGQGFATAGNAEREDETWCSGDKVEVHYKSSWSASDLIESAERIRTKCDRAPSFSTDGYGYPHILGWEKFTDLSKKAISKQISFEAILSHGDGYNLSNPDTLIGPDSADFTTTRDILTKHYLRSGITEGTPPARATPIPSTTPLASPSPSSPGGEIGLIPLPFQSPSPAGNCF